MTVEQASRDDRYTQLRQLRAQVESVQGRRLGAPALPVAAPLVGLLPGGGLRAGSVYSIASSSTLLSALLAQPSQAGAWCALVGVPHWGVEAAARLGVNLSRVVLIPDPGSRWSAVMSTVADVLSIVVIRPMQRVSDGYAARLAARLRERGTVLIVQGPWPGAEAVIDVSAPRWTGVGAGHGYLADRQITVQVSHRQWMRPRREQVLLPATDGTFRTAPGRGTEQGSETGRRRLEAVG